MSSNKSPVLTIDQWKTSEIKYMAPKINDKGGKSVTVISKQTNRAINLSTPLMMTWGISDYVDEKTGESDGKYSLSLQFPKDDEKSPQTDAFLAKLKDFENQILDDAVKNAELWFGDDSLSREVIKHMFFPILKYSKNKDTKKVDYTRPPSIRAKVPNYDGKWGIEIYDPQSNLIFPCENANMTPMDFVPKLSSVACVLSISQLWVGGKGFGLQLKLVQCLVKPKLVETVFGRCHVQLSSEEMKTIETQKLPEKAAAVLEGDDDEVYEAITSASATATAHSTATATTDVPDSDDDEEPAPKTTVTAALETVVETDSPAHAPTSAAAPLAPPEIKKKVVRKKI